MRIALDRYTHIEEMQRRVLGPDHEDRLISLAYIGQAHYFLTGLDIPEKAARIEAQLRCLLDTSKFHTLVFTTTVTPTNLLVLSSLSVCSAN